jgi:hypothetical protein
MIDDYRAAKKLYDRLMDELSYEIMRAPMSKDELRKRMDEIYKEAFPIDPYLTE